jgi:hypothetical protein
MSERTEETKKTNNKRNILVISAIGIIAMAAWNFVGALQCNSRGGEIHFSSFGLTCVQDFRNQ